MANIKARKNKIGDIISYSIRVHKGRDLITGKQLKPYTTTWDVADGWSKKLAQKGIRKGNVSKAFSKVDFLNLLNEKKITRHALSVKMGGKANSIHSLCAGGAVRQETAMLIAEAIEVTPASIFRFETDDTPLKNRTIIEYHLLISTILAEAEKEFLIPYNPASKATPPKKEEHDPNYFQAEDIARIWEALEQ